MRPRTSGPCTGPGYGTWLFSAVCIEHLYGFRIDMGYSEKQLSRIGSWATVLFVALFLIIARRNWGYDDPFITFRYSVNIAEGRGFVYNPGLPGHAVLSTTAPLYALILAGFRVFTLPLPQVSLVISAVSLALGGLALWRLGMAWRSPITAWVALITYPLFPLLVTTVGSETPLTIALVLWGVVAYVERRYMTSAVVLALAILCRADSVLILPILLVHYLISHRKNRASDGSEPFPWGAVGVGAMILAAWFGFAWIYFGSPLPDTLAAKRAQGLMEISQSYWQGIGLFIDQYWGSLRYRWMMVLSLVGLVWLIWRRDWLLILAWSGLHLAAYVALGVTRYYWYYAQLIPGIAVAVGLGAEALIRLAGRWGGKRTEWLLVGLVLISIGTIEGGAVWRMGQRPNPRLSIYQTVGNWLDANTPAEATVGTLEVGIIGYYARRSMIDFAGLLQPEVAEVFAPSTTYEDSALLAIDRYRPDYLVIQDGTLTRTMTTPFIAQACDVQHEVLEDGYPAPMVIYLCQW